jgi:hypothetical protein
LSCFSTPQSSVLPLLCARTFMHHRLYWRRKKGRFSEEVWPLQNNHVEADEKKKYRNEERFQYHFALTRVSTAGAPWDAGPPPQSGKVRVPAGGCGVTCLKPNSDAKCSHLKGEAASIWCHGGAKLSVHGPASGTSEAPMFESFSEFVVAHYTTP